jgi:hypothetical protein
LAVKLVGRLWQFDAFAFYVVVRFAIGINDIAVFIGVFIHFASVAKARAYKDREKSEMSFNEFHEFLPI